MGTGHRRGGCLFKVERNEGKRMTSLSFSRLPNMLYLYVSFRNRTNTWTSPIPRTRLGTTLAQRWNLLSRSAFSIRWTRVYLNGEMWSMCTSSKESWFRIVFLWMVEWCGECWYVEAICSVRAHENMSMMMMKIFRVGGWWKRIRFDRDKKNKHCNEKKKNMHITWYNTERETSSSRISFLDRHHHAAFVQ